MDTFISECFFPPPLSIHHFIVICFSLLIKFVGVISINTVCRFQVYNLIIYHLYISTHHSNLLSNLLSPNISPP